MPQDLMEDSLNTCSVQKNNSTVKKIKKTGYSFQDKGSFIGSLNKALEYFDENNMQELKQESKGEQSKNI